jgi:hypothetical protein
MSIYYNRDLQKEKKDLEKEMRKDKWQETLIAVLKEAYLGQSPNPGHASNVDNQAILGRSVPGESYLQDPAPFVRENNGRHIVSCSQEKQGRASHQMTGPWASHPGSVTVIKAEEPQVKHRSAS